MLQRLRRQLSLFKDSFVLFRAGKFPYERDSIHIMSGIKRIDSVAGKLSNREKAILSKMVFQVSKKAVERENPELFKSLLGAEDLAEHLAFYSQINAKVRNHYGSLRSKLVHAKEVPDFE